MGAVESVCEGAVMTCLRPTAGTVVTCSAPAAATRRSQCQASSCLSPAASVRPATVACSSARRRWTWSWTTQSQRAPTELQKCRAAEEEHKSFTECPPELHVCICCRFLCTDGG